MGRDRAFLTALLALLLATFFFALFVAVPRAASVTLPYRWNGVPLGARREVLLQYLGQPVRGGGEATGDDWMARRSNGSYLMQVEYRDSLSAHYRLLFNYRLGWIRKTYLLREDSLTR